MSNPQQPKQAVKLNEPLITVLRWGAGIPTVAVLADLVGVHRSQLGRALRGRSSPSVRMIDGVARAFPLAPYTRLVVAADTPLEQLAEEVGLTRADVEGARDVQDED